MSAAEEVLAAVRAGGLIEPGQRLLVLLSGGRDSVCLLDVTARILGAGSISALHVNYGLRAAAADDEQYCRTLCEQLGIGLTVHHATLAPSPGNIQAWARDVRYALAAQLALERGAAMAAGHTATDQVETILYRLASSPSRRALLGMRARDGLLVRPLLSVTREQTEAYCRERELDWCDDETNDSDKYARGRVRHGLVPALREVHPGADANVLALAEILRDEANVLDGLVDQILKGRQEVELAVLREQPPALARLVAQQLADGALGRPAPGCARRLEELLALRDTGTAHLDLPHGVRATVSDGLLSFGLTPSRPHP